MMKNLYSNPTYLIVFFLFLFALQSISQNIPLNDDSPKIIHSSETKFKIIEEREKFKLVQYSVFKSSKTPYKQYIKENFQFNRNNQPSAENKSSDLKKSKNEIDSLLFIDFLRDESLLAEDKIKIIVNKSQSNTTPIKANTADSLALVAFFNQSNYHISVEWINTSGWLNEPVQNWFGVTLNEEGKVVSLELPNNGISFTPPAEIGKLDALENLILTGNRIMSLPDEIGNLSNLLNLELGENSIDDLPNSVSNLSNLIHLNLRNNRLNDFSESLSFLNNLEILDLSGNRISEIPENIKNLENLKYLYLGSNQIANPTPIFQLANLEGLSLNGNKLFNLNSQIEGLTNLKSLNLSSNYFYEFPNEIFNLSNLSTLRLEHINLLSLPPDISKLNNLQNLHIGYNKLKELPPEIGQLTKLERLDITRNSLEELPSELGQLTKLNSFFALWNKLKHIPDEIGQLENLIVFQVWGNELENISPGFFELRKLLNLGLSGNYIEVIPTEIYDITSLVTLDLSYNKITDIPEGLSKLVNLKRFTIGGNPLNQLPSEMFNTTSIETLDLREMGFTEIPEEIASLKNLRYLELSDNLISNDIPLFLSALDSLEVLYLDNNHITGSVPSYFSELQNLYILSLRNNNLMGELPVELASSLSLKYLNLDKNAFTFENLIPFFQEKNDNLRVRLRDQKPIDQFVQHYVKTGDTVHITSNVGGVDTRYFWFRSDLVNQQVETSTPNFDIIINDNEDFGIYYMRASNPYVNGLQFQKPISIKRDLSVNTNCNTTQKYLKRGSRILLDMQDDDEGIVYTWDKNDFNDELIFNFENDDKSKVWVVHNRHTIDKAFMVSVTKTLNGAEIGCEVFQINFIDGNSGGDCEEFSLPYDVKFNYDCNGENLYLSAKHDNTDKKLLWYLDESQRDFIGMGDSLLLTENTFSMSYWVVAHDVENGCDSEAVQVEVPLKVENVEICDSRNVELTVSEPYDGEIYWYDHPDANEPIYIGKNLAVNDVNKDSIFWFSVYNNGCESPKTSVEVQLPFIKPDLNFCGNANQWIYLQKRHPDDIIHWFQSETDEIPFFVGTSIQIDQFSDSLTYWVSVKRSDQNCEELRHKITARYSSIVSEPINVQISESTCDTQYFTMSAEVNPDDVQYENLEIHWFNENNVFLSKGNIYHTPQLQDTRSYWARVYDTASGCYSSKSIELIAFVKKPQPPIVSNYYYVVCEGDDVVLVASSYSDELEVQWFEIYNPYTNNPMKTGDTLKIKDISENVSFLVALSDGECLSDYVEVTVEIKEKPRKPELLFDDFFLMIEQTWDSIYLYTYDSIQWYKDDSLILSGQFDKIELDDLGNYYTVGYKNGCYSVSNRFEVTYLDAAKINENRAITLYPNPFNNYITIERAQGRTSQLEVIQLNGKVIYTEFIDRDAFSIHIPTENWPSGFYLVRLIDEKEIKTFKVLKY